VKPIIIENDIINTTKYNLVVKKVNSNEIKTIPLSKLEEGIDILLLF